MIAVHIPVSFKMKQAEVFQDKPVEHYLPVETKGSLGTITTAPATEMSGEYLVNFQMVTDALKAQEWGLIVNKDAIMTKSTAVPVVEGHFIKHNGSTYRVCGILSFDSYTQYNLKSVVV